MISDNIVKWEKFQSGDVVKNYFSQLDWYNIVEDIHSDQEWADFVEAHPDFVSCYILKKCDNGEPLAFIYLLKEYDDEMIVSIHGGGWSKPLLYYRGYILMLRTLMERGYKVRTYCNRDNSSAIRFSRSIGFIPYSYTDSKVYMWINYKRMTSSKLYKYYYSR